MTGANQGPRSTIPFNHLFASAAGALCIFLHIALRIAPFVIAEIPNDLDISPMSFDCHAEWIWEQRFTVCSTPPLSEGGVSQKRSKEIGNTLASIISLDIVYSIGNFFGQTRMPRVRRTLASQTDVLDTAV